MAQDLITDDINEDVVVNLYNTRIKEASAILSSAYPLRLSETKRRILKQREETTELVEYVEDEKRFRHAGLLTRTKWWFRGMD